MGAMKTASTKPDKLAEPRFPYGEVEAGLMAALDIKDQWQTLFRSRIKHFQRLGINGAGVRPGRGASFSYSFEQAARLAIAFLLADIGLDPLLSVELIEKFWEKSLRSRVRRAVAPNARGEHGWFLVLHLTAMRGPWDKDSAVASIGAFQRRRGSINRGEGSIIPGEGVEMWLDHPENMNFCTLALSHVLFRLKDHLDPNGETL
jgi:hypothetical protein